jgi:hypothetical protein
MPYFVTSILANENKTEFMLNGIVNERLYVCIYRVFDLCAKLDDLVGV